jgi:hypothetical protein
MRNLYRAVSLALCLWAAPALACADNEYEQCTSDIPALRVCACLPKVSNPLPGPVDPLKIVVNPMSYINSAGIPMQGDFVEEVIRNPDRAIEIIGNPGQIPYLPVANGMISSRNAIVARGQPMPEDILVKMRRWYSEDLLRSIRWTVDYGPLMNFLQAAWLSFNSDTQAITVINGIVFRDANAASDPARWAHELYHAQQYRDWGVFEFARQWVLNSSEGGPVEAPAYQRENEARQFFNGGPVGAPPPVGFPIPPVTPRPQSPGPQFPGQQAQGSMCVTPVYSCPWMGPVGWSCACAYQGNMYGGTIH